MTETRQPLPPMPARIAKLPRDYRGFPIPWFVATLADGSRDFRIADAGKRVHAIKYHCCWVCGERLGRFMAFPIGPMCVVNRTTAEPPCHLDCATFSVCACPFMIRPRMRRNENDLPPERVSPGGNMIMRNPGAVAIYSTRTYRTFKADGGTLIKLGEPTSIAWFAEGRPATRAEVRASIDSGYPLLLDVARQDGTDAVQELEFCLARAMPLLPAA